MAFRDAELMPVPIELLWSVGLVIGGVIAYLMRRGVGALDKEIDHNEGESIKGYLRRIAIASEAVHPKLDRLLEVNETHEQNRADMEQRLLDDEGGD